MMMKIKVIYAYIYDIMVHIITQMTSEDIKRGKKLQKYNHLLKIKFSEQSWYLRTRIFTSTSSLPPSYGLNQFFLVLIPWHLMRDEYEKWANGYRYIDSFPPRAAGGWSEFHSLTTPECYHRRHKTPWAARTLYLWQHVGLLAH